MGDAVTEKIEYFRAVTGVDDTDLCTDILTAHNWDLEQAISSFTNPPATSSSPSPSSSSVVADPPPPPPTQPLLQQHQQELGLVAPPGIAWRLVTLPFSIIAGTLGLVSGAVGLGLWAVGGILSYSLSTVGLTSPRNSTSTSSPSEAAAFVYDFQQIYGSIRPNFIPEGFNEALQRSRHEFKLLFVYLHSPDHPDTPSFCEGVLCSEVLTAFINENFVAWGGSIRAPEGFKMSNSLKASRFPFCAVVMAATNNRIALLQQVEGLKSTEEMMTILQRVLEESAPVLVSARLDAEERRTNIRLREEQDAAYRAALEADQARERQRKEEEERVEREAAEAERKMKEEEEARERAAREAIEREAALAKLREEKALSLGAEPDKGPDVTQVLVRFPNGERQGRRFHCTSTIQTLYNYVDSLGCLEVENYNLVSNFPRVVYGEEKLNLSLKEAGLHPQASLFVEINS